MTAKQCVVVLTFAAVAVVAATAFAQQPGPDLVQAGINAYNAKDVAYFEKHLAPEAIWLDEDGHIISGRNSVLSFIKNQLSDPAPRKITATNIKFASSGDAAWAGFAYTINHAGKEVKGLNSTVFKKVGNDWMIVLIHGAFDAPGHHMDNE